MAQAKLNMKTETRTEERRVVTEVKAEVPESVTLTLTLDEARLVKSLVGHAFGNGVLRELSDRVYDALDAIGVGSFQPDAFARQPAYKQLDELPSVYQEYLPQPKETRQQRGGDVDERAAFEASEPIAWLSKRHGANEFEFDVPNGKASNPEHWSDAFPVYARPQASTPAVIDLGETGSIYGATIRGQIHVVAKHFGQIRDVSWISDNFSGIDTAVVDRRDGGKAPPIGEGCTYQNSPDAYALKSAPAAEDSAKGAGDDWRLDHSAGRPILVYQNCSVIEAEQAEYVLRLIEADRQQRGEDVCGSTSVQPELRVGALVRITKNNGTPYFLVGDKARVLRISENGDSILADFNNLGNAYVYQDGHWFIGGSSYGFEVIG